VEPLLVHHHLPKTAGRSLRKVMEANYASGELADLTGREEGDPARWYRDYWKSLEPGAKTALRCVSSHNAQHLIPAVEDRPVRAFCTLREPVERVISLVFFIAWMDEHGRHSPMLAAMRERDWRLGDVYRRLGRGGACSEADAALFWPLFNGQAREIAAPYLEPSSAPFDPRAPGLEGLGDRVTSLLSEHYVVGVSERLSQSVRLFAESFGWRRTFVPEVNVRPYGFQRSEIDDETRALIRAHNRVDAELHAGHLTRVAALPGTSRAGDLRWRAGRRGRRALRRTRSTARRVLGGLPLARAHGRSRRTS
jgi:hypothetical protein